jgi:predicted house-cleaning NTP pyrophosphatase (Maf/HAM1 superfamily)
MEINKPIILASGSPRRLEIMRKHGIEPLVIPADVEETVPENISPSEVPVYLAELKAEAVSVSCGLRDGLIIALIPSCISEILTAAERSWESRRILKTVSGCWPH